MHFIKGKAEDTLRAHDVQLPERISVLRLDTDFHESTRSELDVLFRRLVSGGVLIIDDYCTWAGARKAVDEWLEGTEGIRQQLRKVHGKGTKLCFRASKV